MKKLLLSIAILFPLLSVAPVSAKPKKGYAPEVYGVKGSALGYRALPAPLTTPYFITCFNTTGNCATNAISFKVRDRDSRSVVSRHRVTDSAGKVVHLSKWYTDVPLYTGDGYQHSWFWTPSSSAGTGRYKLWVQVRDNKGNTTAWVATDPILFL